MERKNINRGFKQLHVWQDSISLYILACKVFSTMPFPFRKVAENAVNAAHSISRNIAEGYCRRSKKEYLSFLNIALGSCGELHSCYVSFHNATQINTEQYEKLDELHYKTENELIGLIRALQQKQKQGGWIEHF
jgi:four helix bundle protein